MKNRFLERLKRKRLRYEKGTNMTAIDPITGEDLGPDAEDHHVAGRRYHEDTIPLNPNGHQPVSDAFRDLPSPIPGPVRELERIGRYLLGVIIILDFVLDRLWEMGQTLIATARADANRETKAENGSNESAPRRAARKRAKPTENE
jgi:hypothetical protein